MSNLKFSYLYRDAGNYKKCASVTFSNPDSLAPESIEKTLRRCFLEECLFIAEQVRVPNCFLYARGNASSSDHCFHEFERLEMTRQAPDDLQGRSISQFVEEVEREASHKWKVFDPHELPDIELTR